MVTALLFAWEMSFPLTVCNRRGSHGQSGVLTGEPLPVKRKTTYVYAGTVVEEGEIVLQVREMSGSTRFEKIVTMIEDSEKLKSTVESRAEHLADRLVPYTLLGTGLIYALTRNATKALAVLMVDFSCALKLAMPISVLSAIREAGSVPYYRKRRQISGSSGGRKDHRIR